MFFKKTKNTPVPDPVVPEGWALFVRPQETSYSKYWNYLLVPPERVVRVMKAQEYKGSNYHTKRSATIQAIEIAEMAEQAISNANQKWERV